eukprot:scaffold131539_cov43-Cyclotella_meneghiniana.AAC.1
MLRTILSKTKKGHTQAIPPTRAKRHNNTISKQPSSTAAPTNRIAVDSWAHQRDRPVRLLDDDGSTGRNHATINGAAAMIDGSRCTKCVCAGGTAISGWLLCESRRCFCYG